MTPEEILQNYIKSYQFQTDVYEAVISRLESGFPLGVGKRLSHDSCALFGVVAPNKGILFPNMTNTQRDAIINPLPGLVIYNSTDSKLNVFTTIWEQINSA